MKWISPEENNLRPEQSPVIHSSARLPFPQGRSSCSAAPHQALSGALRRRSVQHFASTTVCRQASPSPLPLPLSQSSFPHALPQADTPAPESQEKEMTPGPGDATEAPATVQPLPYIVSGVVLLFFFYFMKVHSHLTCYLPCKKISNPKHPSYKNCLQHFLNEGVPLSF